MSVSVGISTAHWSLEICGADAKVYPLSGWTEEVFSFVALPSGCWYLVSFLAVWAYSSVIDGVGVIGSKATTVNLLTRTICIAVSTAATGMTCRGIGWLFDIQVTVYGVQTMAMSICLVHKHGTFHTSGSCQFRHRMQLEKAFPEFGRATKWATTKCGCTCSAKRNIQK